MDMQTTRTLRLAMAAVGLAVTASAADKVTVRSLLAEMTDPDANTYLPAPRYTTRLWSSHDRRTTTPGADGWFANDDHSKFIRSETVDGRTEDVMLDVNGPGAITRFWITVSDKAGEGKIRVYIDGRLAVEDNCLKLVSGGTLCAAPLSDSVPHESSYAKRGHDLYLPIPYAKSCRVAYVREPGTKGAFYYNVETRAYQAGTEVESFSLDVLRRERAAIDAANRKLARGLNGADKPADETLSFDGEIPAGASVSRTVARAGGGAIRRLSMSVDCGKKPQALRSTVIEMSFDGERTVWVPAGEFFGCGYTYEPYSSWFTSCSGVGRMESRWTMPFERECTVTVRNLGDVPVILSTTAMEVGPYRWDPARRAACTSAHAGTNTPTHLRARVLRSFSTTTTMRSWKAKAFSWAPR